MKFKIEVDLDNPAFTRSLMTGAEPDGSNFGVALIQTMRRITAHVPLNREEAKEFQLSLMDEGENEIARAYVDLEAERPPETIEEAPLPSEENEFILCEKCQASTHREDAMRYYGKMICLDCWRNTSDYPNYLE
jgi:hypothetical protein